MIKQIIIVLLLLFGSKMIFSQNYFDNFYSYGKNSEFHDYLHLLPNGNYLTVGIGSNSSGYGFLLREVNDIDGIVQDHFIEFPSGDDILHSIAQIGNNILLSDKTIILIISSTEPIFLKYHLNTRTILNTQIYEHDYGASISSSVLHKDGYIYSGGRCYVDPEGVSNKTNMLLMKIDTAGNLIWEKTYENTKKDYIFSIESFNNNLYITYKDEFRITHLAKLDTAGNILKSVPRKVTGVYGIDKIEAYKDKLFFLHSTSETYITYETTYLAEIDKDLNIVWDKYLLNSSKYALHYRCIDISNDQIVIAGTILDNNEFTKGPINACASAYDLQGNLLWEHIYDHDTTFLHHLDDVVADENGDLIFMGTISGRTETATGSFLWLFKTDSEGCGTVQEVCYNSIEDYAIASGLLIDVPENELNNFNIVEILGNPFGSHLKLQTINSKPLQLKFYNTAGQLFTTKNLSKQLSLNTQAWPAGIYFMQVYDGGKLLAVEKLLRQ